MGVRADRRRKKSMRKRETRIIKMDAIPIHDFTLVDGRARYEPSESCLLEEARGRG